MGQGRDEMVAINLDSVDVVEEEDGIVFLDPEEGRAQFDALAREWLGITGDEFIEKWDAGDYRGIADTEANRPVIVLSMLIPVDL